MSRNSEKQGSMLHRFQQQQANAAGLLDVGRTVRPTYISGVESLPQAEKWRSQVMKEISRKVTKIQDPALSDFQLRDLNDEINKLMNERHRWDLQIRSLGGPNYASFGGKKRGYQYYGRARELPGVAEMLTSQTQDESKPSDFYIPPRNLNMVYYGYTDDNVTGLLEFEQQREKELEEMLAGKPDESSGFVVGDISVPEEGDLEARLLEERKRRVQALLD
ncbi:Pre-mRNA-splicing factor ISY1 [Yarrowia sp. B02]|nr:Pre-mRNA-splicing factor ISY1 [Yarrowia sp. B02]